MDRMKGQLDGKMKDFEEVAAYKSALQQKTEQYMELEEKYRGVCIRNVNRCLIIENAGRRVAATAKFGSCTADVGCRRHSQSVPLNHV